MASNDGFDTHELDLFTADLAKASIGAQLKAQAVLKVCGSKMEADAKNFAPVDTGNLKNSIGTDTEPMSVSVGPSAEYGVYVELGTSRMGPQPYLGPAFDRASAEFVDMLGDIVGDLE